MDYVRGRFAQDFGGADLLVLGGSDFKAKATLDGYFTETKKKGFSSTTAAGSRPPAWARATTPRFRNTPGEGAANAARSCRAATATRTARTGKPRCAKARLGSAGRLERLRRGGRGRAHAGNRLQRVRHHPRVRPQYLGLNKRNVKFLWHDAPL